MSHYTATIQRPIEFVWQHLLLKIERPELFVPTVHNVEILEKTADFVIRKMSLIMDNQVVTIVEKITANPYIVRFDLLEHPKFTGFVLNEIVAIDEHSCSLTYDLNWTDPNTQKTVDASEMAKKSVLHSIAFMEKETL